jgi:hypothetical protein
VTLDADCHRRLRRRARPRHGPPDPSVFPLGDGRHVHATDASGNVATATTPVTVVDTPPPVLTGVPPPVTVEQTSHRGTPVHLPRPRATDVCDASPRVTSDAPDVFPLGRTVVTFTATDDSGNRTRARTTVTVVDTTPPAIKDVEARPCALWPPNHKMRSVRLDVDVKDVCDVAPSCQIVSVTSNEPVGTGATHVPDWVVTGKLTADLRAERSGAGTVASTGSRCAAPTIPATARRARRPSRCPKIAAAAVTAERDTMRTDPEWLRRRAALAVLRAAVPGPRIRHPRCLG